MAGTLPAGTSLFEAAAACLAARDVEDKLEWTQGAVREWRSGRLVISAGQDVNWCPQTVPGRPQRPRLVAPKHLPRRNFHSTSGRAVLIHAITHIEFNAINLAWDAIQRFVGLPAAYYDDWVRVAEEEARHFRLLRERLNALGYEYGDFDAHDGLWEMAEEMAYDPLARMALVPRVLEARGLDVTPVMMERFRIAGDEATAAILAVILRDEVGHVAVGSRWLRYLCHQRRLEAEATSRELIARHMKGALKGPFNLPARRAAGFSESELTFLEQRSIAGK